MDKKVYKQSVTRSIRITPELAEKIEVLAASDNRSFNYLVTRILEDYVKTKKQ